MISFTDRLNKAIEVAAYCHEKQNQHRKGTDLPYIVHPFSVMLISSQVTNNEDILIACLLHDILEDVDTKIYSKEIMIKDFGKKVTEIVIDVTKNPKLSDWHEVSNDYINHLNNSACDEAIIVSASDKIHNLRSTISDYKTKGDILWQIFKTKSRDDQIWFYQSIIKVLINRKAPQPLISSLDSNLAELIKITTI